MIEKILLGYIFYFLAVGIHELGHIPFKIRIKKLLPVEMESSSYFNLRLGGLIASFLVFIIFKNSANFFLMGLALASILLLIWDLLIPTKDIKLDETFLFRISGVILAVIYFKEIQALLIKFFV